MKKFFLLVLAVCMLMSAVSFAEQNAVLQDEQPPMIVTTENEAGETVVALVRDAQGNVASEILDDGSIELTDVHFRSEAANDVIIKRLTDAYEGVMRGVHYGDVDCQLHDHEVSTDINELLATIDTDLDAHDLVMTELFDIAWSENVSAMLTEGNYVEITFAANAPLVAIYTVDGIEWSIIPTIAAPEGFTVQLTENGTMALLADGRAVIALGESRTVSSEEKEETGDDDQETDDMINVPVDFESVFTPSATGKPAPDMIIFDNDEGESFIGFVSSDSTSTDDSTSDSETNVAVPNRNYVIVTPVVERDYVADVMTHEHLEWSYDSILNTSNVGELYAGENGTIASQLDAALAQLESGLTCDQLAVKDLFEVSAYGDYLQMLYDETSCLNVTFDANLDPEKTLVVITSSDSVHWNVCPVEDVTLNADGTVSIRLYDLGTVAFLVETEADVAEEAPVQSPE